MKLKKALNCKRCGHFVSLPCIFDCCGCTLCIRCVLDIINCQVNAQTLQLMYHQGWDKDLVNTGVLEQFYNRMAGLRQGVQVRVPQKQCLEHASEKIETVASVPNLGSRCCYFCRARSYMLYPNLCIHELGCETKQGTEQKQSTLQIKGQGWSQWSI